jgi:putative MATE family efflux protein
MLLAALISKPMFELLCSNHNVAVLADEYFMIRMSVCFLMVSNYAFRGYWNAVDQSKIYMNSLVLMNLLNIVLNYLLIFGNFGFPKMGVNGSAISTAIATTVGALFYLYIAYKNSKSEGFLRRLPTLQELGIMAKISVTSSSETVLTMFNVAVMYWVAGQISAYALAGINILMNMLLVVYLPAIALGITLATLAGQALGRGDKEDAFEWGIDMMKLGFVICCILAVPYLFFPEIILRLFTQSEEVISVTLNATRIMGLTLGFEVIAFIFLDALKGLGYAAKPMMITAGLNWLLYLPSICVMVFVFKQGLFSIWFAQSVINFILGLWLYKIWLSRKWQRGL